MVMHLKKKKKKNLNAVQNFLKADCTSTMQAAYKHKVPFTLGIKLVVM